MIVGTAGHIDHGKTSLVRALTGVDTDRLKEEKARGISIELGYAYTDDGRLGFVDVPGHERFIPTMLAGATGIDFALLVVAADDGVMPQTVEHLEILDLLGVAQGAVALTKTDRVDAARLAEAEREVEALLAPTRLAGAPVFPVSPVTGAGLEALRAHLQDAAAAWRRPVREEHFRLAVDRSFALQGVGTVVTGTVFAGEVRVGDDLAVSPAGGLVRVRGIRAQNRKAEAGRRGERCAIALAGVARDEVARGDWLVAPFLHAPTSRFDLRLRLLAREAKPLVHGAPVHVHLGAAHRLGRVALLQGERLEPGGEMPAQVVLDEPIACAAGDICVLRDAAATRTLGGGPVLDPWGPSRYRRSPERLAALAALALPDEGEALTAVVAASATGVDLAAFARGRNRRLDSLALPAEGRRVGERCFAAGVWEALRERLIAGLAAFHEKTPDEAGLHTVRLRPMLFPQHGPEVTVALVDELVAEGKLARSGPWIHLPEHRVRLTAAEEKLAARLRARMAGAAAPLWVRDLAGEMEGDEAELRRLMQRLMKLGELLQVVRDLYITPELAVGYARIVARLEAEEGGALAARFRDETGLGRKRAIQVLEFFDRVGYTRRAGERHRLRGGAAPTMFGQAPCAKSAYVFHCVRRS